MLGCCDGYLGVRVLSTWTACASIHLADCGPLRPKAAASEMDMSILQQDMIVVVDKGHCWSLGLLWWSICPNTQAFRESVRRQQCLLP